MPNTETMKLRMRLGDLVTEMLEKIDGADTIEILQRELELVKLGERARKLERERAAGGS